MNSARYLVGIDLGTTNCAVAYVDTREGRAVRDFPIAQWVAAGIREARDLLPSTLIALAPHERTPEDERVDRRWRAGYYARDLGSRVESRCIQSAKSWLCHKLVDREAPILPWRAEPDVPKISPIEAQAILLAHMRAAWDEAHPDAPLAEQEVYVTVPASFDDAAREYTLAAARKAGLSGVRLLEEPQAAFYAWLAAHEASWDRILQPGDHVWVCDVGGGTTDFTLIDVRRGADGSPSLHRAAVGEHLILGGDNLDLALALELEARWGIRLDAWTLPVAVAVCRSAKEALLSENAPDTLEIVLPARGAHLIGGSRRASVRREEIRKFLLDGFLPQVPFDAPVERGGSALQVFGLPYAKDAAITRHAAEFLRRHLPRDTNGSPRPPRAILFNGGFFMSEVLRQRFLEVAKSWFSSGGTSWAPLVLDSPRLDLAVARGAAYYALAQHGLGVRIRSTLGRAYYLALGASADSSGAPRGVCIAPADLEPGHRVAVEALPIRARVNVPVSFQVAHSHSRLQDRCGDIVELSGDDVALSDPIHTTISTNSRKAGDLIDVILSAELTEIGTLDLLIHARNAPQRWRLTFDARESRSREPGKHQRAQAIDALDSKVVEAARDAILKWFSLPPAEAEQRSIFKAMEAALGISRSEWSAALGRSCWETAMDIEERRRQSPGHEIGWLNLVGFLLRPGYGFPGDEARVQSLWRVMSSGPVHINREAVRCAAWIFWRRIAGGLSRGQQTALAGPLAKALRELAAGKAPSQPPLKRGAYETIEVLRLLASLERWSASERESLADRVAEAALGKAKWVETQVARWALARLGARQPAYGPLNAVLPADKAENWLAALLEALPKTGATEHDLFAVASLARRTGDRMRDVSEALRARALEALRCWGTAPHLISMVESGGEWESAERAEEFGEALPPGLLL